MNLNNLIARLEKNSKEKKKKPSPYMTKEKQKEILKNPKTENDRFLVLMHKTFGVSFKVNSSKIEKLIRKTINDGLKKGK